MKSTAQKLGFSIEKVAKMVLSEIQIKVRRHQNIFIGKRKGTSSKYVCQLDIKF